MSWRLVFTSQARRDARKLASAGLKPRAEALLDVLVENPYGEPSSGRLLVGDLAGSRSRRITIQHRLVYQVLDEETTVKVLRMWTHYEG